MYCLTVNGELGKIIEENDNYLFLNQLSKNGDFKYDRNRNVIKSKICKDEVYLTSNNIDFLNVQRDKLIDFSNFINIGFDIEKILYDYFDNYTFHAEHKDKILEYLDKFGLTLIYLHNTIQYIIIKKKSIGKSITIKVVEYLMSHLIGRHGNNIQLLKNKYNFKNISIKSLEVEEYRKLEKAFCKNLLFLVNQ